MDILYYSNHCPHSQKILHYISRAGLIDKLNAICIDKRTVDPNSGQIYISLENGKKIMLPPNIQSVPALLIVKQNYRALFGKDIMAYFEPGVKERTQQAQQQQGEPVGISLAASSAGVAIHSEQYTLYDLSPDDLSAKSTSAKRPMYQYVSAQSHQPFQIPTPPDTYRPDKVDSSLTVEALEQKRNTEVSSGQQSTPFGF
jgi:5-keto 4-deoxyuronate isomerase